MKHMLFISLLALAMSANVNAHESWQLSGFLGTNVKLDLDALSDSRITSKNSLGYGLALGMPVGKFFMIDLGYQNLGESKYRVNAFRYDQQVHNLSLSTRFTMPVHTHIVPDFDAYLRIGYEGWKAQSDIDSLKVDGSNLYYGLGVSVKADRNIDFTLETQFHDTKSTDALDANIVSVLAGLRYNF